MTTGTKFIFVTGGVVSGLGKGITAASLGRLLKQRGLRVRGEKVGPHLLSLLHLSAPTRLRRISCVGFCL